MKNHNLLAFALFAIAFAIPACDRKAEQTTVGQLETGTATTPKDVGQADFVLAQKQLDAGNHSEAVRLYRLAAEAGHSEAQSSLGWMLENGRGSPINYAEAEKWYRLAADSGNANARYNLGEMYANGRGMKKNIATAEKWYRLAAELGHRGAVRAMDKLIKPHISLTGEWSYDGYPHNSLHLTLRQSGNRIRGTHVAIALGGNRIDAYLDDEESINGTINGDMARVNFKSAYFDGGGGVAIIKILDEKTIEWTVIEEREHWFPKSAILTKDK